MTSGSDEGASAYRLELKGVCKAYPGTIANDRIDIRVKPGEIHAVLGENGAGKSTLMKIIYGLVRPDAGEVAWNGAPVRIRSPRDAQALGIGMVMQHFSLFETLTAAQNIGLALSGRPDIDSLSRQVAEVSQRYGLPVNPAQLVHTLSVGERQRVEIVRCLLQSPRLIIMDEPTSVLSPQAVEQLFRTLRQLAAEGCSILYISHKLEEIRALCDTATVLRNGRVSGVCTPKDETPASLARLMIGSELPSFRKRAPTPAAKPLLSLKGVSTRSDDPFGVSLANIDLTVHAGEIVGIAGVSGNGQKELMEIVSGERRLAERQAVRIDGIEAAHLGPRQRRAMGLCFVPEERLGRGAVPSLPLSENALLTAGAGLVRHGLVQLGKVEAFARRCIGDYAVKCSGPAAPASSLSGGNLQKFIVGREILQKPKVFVVAQPTWGVDVGSAAFIRQAMLDLAASGSAVLVVSEELSELFEIADRIAVIAGGRLSRPRPAAETNAMEIGLAMTGHPAAASATGPVSHAMEVSLATRV